MNLIAKLFGSDAVIAKTADGIYNGIDKSILTNEEKLDIQMQLLKLYEPFKLAQRLLALTFGIPYALAWLTTFIASFWRDIEAQMEFLNGDLGTIVLVIVGFYFAGGTLGSLLQSKK